MTTTLERPNPYRIKPKASSLRKSARRSASTQPAKVEPALETFRQGLRAMTHERVEDAQSLLRAVATEEALTAGDPIAIDALAYLSSVVWKLGDPVTAIDLSDRALELGPDRFATNQKAGEMAVRLGLLDKAESRFLAALRASEPGTPEAKVAEKCLLEARKRTARGIKHGADGLKFGRLLSRLSPIARHAEHEPQQEA
jgi:hypothetical protein